MQVILPNSPMASSHFYFFSSVLKEEPANEESNSILERVTSIIDKENDNKKAPKRKSAKKVYVVS